MNITIQERVVNRGTKQTSVEQLCKLVAQHTLTGMRDKPIPDNVRWLVECGDRTVYILELQPELRQVLWSNYAHGGQFYTVATPYVVVLVPICVNHINGSVEVYYRNQPLQSIDDHLCLTNLKNIVQYAGRSHLCLDGLQTTMKMSQEDILNELVNHLWSGEFNDECDGNHFRTFVMNGGDARLASIESWQAASLADPSFVLGVNWLPARVTVRGIIEHHFASNMAPVSAQHLCNLILRTM